MFIECNKSAKMKNLKISTTDKQRLIDAYEANEDFLALADVLKIKKTTARTLIRRHRLNLHAAPHGGQRHSKVTDAIKEYLRELIENTPTLTLKEMQTNLLVCRNTTLSLCTISNVLDGMLITLKLIRDIPIQRNSERTKHLRSNYATWFLEKGQMQRCIFIDECGFNVWTRRSYGRNVRGHQATRVIAKQRGHNLTICLAVGEEGVVKYDLYEGGTTRVRFQSFIDNLSNHLFGQQCFFIMDNLAAHHKTLPPIENHTMHYLSPYSPFLNPVEECFSVLKASIKRLLAAKQNEFDDQLNANAAGLNMSQWRLRILRQVVTVAMEDVTVEKCRKFFRHMLTFLPASVRKDNI